MSKVQNITYTIYVTDLHDKIDNIENVLKKHFKIAFIAYDQSELKISFEKELSDEQEDLLISLIHT